MNKIKIFSLIAVFTALFASCEEPQEGTDTPTGGGNSGTEVDYTKFKCLKTLEGNSNYVNSVAYSPDGTKIISGSGNSFEENNDNTIKIWDVTTGECLETLGENSNYVNSVAYSPDGTKIISGSDDKTVKIWDANTGACLKTLEGHSDWVESVAYSPDGTKIISGSWDRTIKIWDANYGV